MLLILFLIYIRNLFLKIKAKFLQVQTSSYIDNIALYIERPLAKENCRVLQRAVKTVFEWTAENTVKFDDSKSELIHFFRKKQEAKNSVTLLNNTIAKLVKIIKWLSVWLNKKLNFKEHVQQKIAAAIRNLHLLNRLFNSK